MSAPLHRQATARKVLSSLTMLLSYTRFTITAASSPICYNSLGSPDDSYVPCDPAGTITHACCRPGDICFQNGLCVGQNNTGITPYYTSMCIVPSYNVTGCFDNCNDSAGNGVQECGSTTSGEYCCYGFSGCDCNDNSEVFGLGVAVALTTVPLLASGAASTSSDLSTTTQASTPYSVASITTRTATVTSLATTRSSSIPAGAATTLPASTSGGTNHTAQAIGLGVGIPVGVIGLLLLFWFYQRQKRRGQSEALAQAFDKFELDGGRECGYLPNNSGLQEAYDGAKLPAEKEAKERVFEMPGT